MKKYKVWRYLAILGLVAGVSFSCKSPTSPSGGTPRDTTSNDFTFTQYTFGGNAGSSGFKDVAIVNDNDIWAVGTIYTAPDTMYNAAHWDGNKWTLKKITVSFRGNLITPSLDGVFTFSPTDIWFVGSLPIHGDGQTWNIFDLRSTPGLDSISLSRAWGASPESVYFVGNGGSIAHYSDGMWNRMESGTRIDLRDVWGTPDGSVVWACGWSNDESQSILLKYDGTRWKTVWSRNGTSVDPYGYFVTSLWETDTLISATGRGVFKDTTQIATLPWFPYRIRGTADNDIAVAGDEGMIWHWNGADWKQLNLQSDEPLYSVAISKTILVVVGSDFNIGLGAALIYVGKRE
jgi:hypothetical protein